MVPILGVMKDRRPPQRAVTDARRAWILGGALLIGSVATQVILQPATWVIFGASLVGEVLFFLAVMIFAFGVRRAGSLTARRPLGSVALVVFATSFLLDSVMSGVIPGSGLSVDSPLTFGYVSSLVQFCAALIATIQIGRAGTLPYPWNWAPAWVLASVAAAWVLSRVLTVESEVALFASLISIIEGLVRLGGPLFLGVLAIVLANRTKRPQTVAVYPPA